MSARAGLALEHARHRPLPGAAELVNSGHAGAEDEEAVEVQGKSGASATRFTPPGAAGGSGGGTAA